MKSFLLTGVSIASEASPDVFPADIVVENGIITHIAPQLATLSSFEGMVRVDGGGGIAIPGMFDAHVHARQPGGEAKETIATASLSAVAGGVTGIVLMPNTSPAIDSAALVKFVLDTAKKESPIPVMTSGCVTKGRKGQELAAIAGMLGAGVKMLTDDGDAIEDLALMKRAMEYTEGMDCFFASHCETESLAGPRAMTQGKVSHALGIMGSPPCSEEMSISRDIALAHATGTPIHIQHVSTKLGMDIIAFWKEQGARVSAEVTPHHLLFNESHVGNYDTHYKMNPPLRTPEDAAALLEGLKTGIIDMIATDHAPHTPFEKAQDFVSAPNGILGLQTAVLSLYEGFIAKGIFGWDMLISRYSSVPRAMMGLPPVVIKEGAAADFFVFSPDKTTSITADSLCSKSQNTPFLNQRLQGSIDFVVLGDKVLLNQLA